MYTWYNDIIIIIVIIIIVSAENVNFHPSLWNAYQLRSQIKTVYRYNIYASVGLLSNSTYYTYIYTCWLPRQDSRENRSVIAEAV